MALFIRTDGTIETVAPAAGAAFTLQEIQERIGGYMEVVGLHGFRGGAYYLVVNEDGIRLQLERNAVATEIAQSFSRIVVGPWGILGNVLVATVEELGGTGEGES